MHFLSVLEKGVCTNLVAKADAQLRARGFPGRDLRTFDSPRTCHIPTDFWPAWLGKGLLAKFRKFLERDPVFLYFSRVGASVRVQTDVRYARNTQERSTRILWNIAPRIYGEGFEHIKSSKKTLYQNSVKFDKLKVRMYGSLRKNPHSCA
jgi:hypothetical protein